MMWTNWTDGTLALKARKRPVFDETKIKRQPAGAPKGKGGEFAPKADVGAITPKTDPMVYPVLGSTPLESDLFQSNPASTILVAYRLSDGQVVIGNARMHHDLIQDWVRKTRGEEAAKKMRVDEMDGWVRGEFVKSKNNPLVWNKSVGGE